MKLSICITLLLLASAAKLPGGPTTSQAQSGERQVQKSIAGIHGVLRVDELHIGVGEELAVDGDLEIHATRTVLIEGKVQCRRSLDAKHLHAPSIQIRAGESITVTGAIYGAAGGVNNSPGGRGGDGTSITLLAPVVWIDGVARGGDAGLGGVAINNSMENTAGVGGAVDIYGFYFTHRPASEQPTCWSPDNWGAVGGMGNPGGSAISWGPLPGYEDQAFLTVKQDADGEVGAKSQHALLTFDCPVGTFGTPGGPSTGGAGINGAPGIPGSAGAPNGTNGTNGTTPGDGVGGGAGNGGDGSDCCPNTGGAGGGGGLGGVGTGGPGGAGGAGGAGYQPGNGAGGNGGSGATGGNGKGGKGGNGGKGGPRKGVGGAGGGSPAGVGGAGGTFGSGGTGSPPGANGSAGGTGGALSGDAGNAGGNGGICPTGG